MTLLGALLLTGALRLQQRFSHSIGTLPAPVVAALAGAWHCGSKQSTAMLSAISFSSLDATEQQHGLPQPHALAAAAVAPAATPAAGLLLPSPSRAYSSSALNAAKRRKQQPQPKGFDKLLDKPVPFIKAPRRVKRPPQPGEIAAVEGAQPRQCSAAPTKAELLGLQEAMLRVAWLDLMAAHPASRQLRPKRPSLWQSFNIAVTRAALWIAQLSARVERHAQRRETARSAAISAAIARAANADSGPSAEQSAGAAAGAFKGPETQDGMNGDGDDGLRTLVEAVLRAHGRACWSEAAELVSPLQLARMRHEHEELAADGLRLQTWDAKLESAVWLNTPGEEAPYLVYTPGTMSLFEPEAAMLAGTWQERGADTGDTEGEGGQEATAMNQRPVWELRVATVLARVKGCCSKAAPLPVQEAGSGMPGVSTMVAAHQAGAGPGDAGVRSGAEVSWEHDLCGAWIFARGPMPFSTWMEVARNGLKAKLGYQPAHNHTCSAPPWRVLMTLDDAAYGFGAMKQWEQLMKLIRIGSK